MNKNRNHPGTGLNEPIRAISGKSHLALTCKIEPLLIGDVPEELYNKVYEIPNNQNMEEQSNEVYKKEKRD